MKRKRPTSNRLDALEFKVWQSLKPFKGLSLLAAVSGGMDSVVLLHLLKRVQERLGIKISVAHVHHGYTSDAKVLQARGKAQNFVESLAGDLGFPFLFNKRAGATELRSEAELRDWRLEALEELRVRANATLIAMAHHQDDLLETRLLRLIRGTGPEGVRAMRLRSGHKVRPLLGIERKELAAYARKRGIEWLEDPTNSSRGPLRNWIRLKWLPELEKKRPGSKDALTRSFQLIAERLSAGREADAYARLGQLCLSGAGITRGAYAPLSLRQRRFVLSLYLRSLNARGIGHTQIQEIAKRLDTDQNSLTFRVGSLNWVVNAEQIRAFPAGVSNGTSSN